LSEFNSAIDIANRACDHIGVGLLDATLGFADPDSKAAQRIGAVYGKLRRAELRRNYWKFALKHAVLRPISATTMMLAPSLWVSDTTYFVGSIVLDDQGTFWISRQPNNLGNQPQNTPAWEPYCGSLTVEAWDATTTYTASEVVYTATGDGKNRVYISRQNSNSDNPATATAWAATGQYFKNQVVTYSAVAYMSLIDLNTNNIPSAAPALFNIATSYSIGNRG